MNKSIEYIYSVPNASCTLRIVEHLSRKYQSFLNSVAVINLVDRWLIKISLKQSITYEFDRNLQAFFGEMGTIHKPSARVLKALASLERGESPTAVMNRYQVVIVVYGKPETEEIEIFRDRIVDRLGYCPQNMA